MAKAGTVRPCDPKRAKGKFEAVGADGKPNPYVFRTEAEAWAALPDKAPVKEVPAKSPPATPPAVETKTE